MASLNKVFLIGRLGQNPEIRMTQTGKKVANLSLATSENYTDKSGNKQQKTEWHRIILFDRNAELAETYLAKGSLIHLDGKLQTREWTDKQGVRHWTTEIIGFSIQFLDQKGQNQGAPQPQGYGQQANQQSQGYNQPQQQQGQDYGGYGPNDFIEDDIPY